MSKEGEQLNTFIQELLNFFGQISVMLGTTEKMMAEKKWKPYDNRAFANTSRHINNPQYWVPGDLFRFYLNDDRPNILAFVAVILHIQDDEVEEDIKEPMITAGYFEWEKGGDARKGWQYWYSRFHFYNEHWTDDGKWHDINPSTAWPNEKEQYPFETAHTFALPLVSIQKVEDLKSKIIDIIFQKIE